MYYRILIWVYFDAQAARSGGSLTVDARGTLVSECVLKMIDFALKMMNLYLRMMNDETFRKQGKTVPAPGNMDMH